MTCRSLVLHILVSWLLVLPAAMRAAPRRTQAPDAPWLTFTTAHYRIHCPAAFESFGAEVAGRVEGIHAQYRGLVGFAYENPTRPIDILILDPVLEANGMALPLLPRPQVILWKTPPEVDSIIGHHRGWAELLVAHELGHMHHLLRPARRPTLWQRWTALLGPLPEKAPRWVTEGYATLLEGKLTGSGRPHSALRAAVLRQWALEGKLPAYAALSGTQGFLGGSMAYLGGSAYLGWLENRATDPTILQTLWLRMAGRRDFDAAFLATFGFSPQDGYQRFCAELTHSALELERRVKALGLREGDLVTQLPGWATDLALSPDGKFLLARVLAPERPGLWVWNLKEGPKASQPLPGEPADHAPLRPVLPPTHRLGRIDGALPWKPRWTAPDRIGFQLRLPDEEGVLVPQPRQWVVGGGLADATPPSPTPPPAGPSWKEVDGVWNLVDVAGRPLTRTLGAAWNPVVTPDGRWIYFTQLTAAGLQIRRLDATLPALADTPLPEDPAALIEGVVLPKPDAPSPLPPPVGVEPHPYRIGETHHTLSLAGYSATPSGLSAQVGLGGNDLLGRLNWQVLAGIGDGAGPRGALAGASWHGWRWAPSLQAFSLLERPSSQQFEPVQGFDRERRGAELAIEYQDRGRPQARFRPVLVFERATLAAGKAFGRVAWGGEGLLAQAWSRDEQGLDLAFAVQEQWGRSDGQTWRLTRLAATVGWQNPWAPLSLRAETGQIGGEPTALDRFHLGGVSTSLLPFALDANRVAQPALPAYLATGNRLLRLRGMLNLGPVQAYVDQATVWQDTDPRPTAQRVAGLELDSRRLGLPQDILRRLVGNLSFTLGLHRPLDGAMKGRTVGTLSVIVRP